MRIGVLGGTGPEGKAMAARLASVGFTVTVGSRSHDRAVETVHALKERWPDHELALEGGDNAAAASAAVVFVATPWDAAGVTALSVAEHLTGKVLVCIANALVRVGGEFQALVPPRGSVAAHVQALVPQALIAAAFHHLPARQLAAIDLPMEGDVLVCSDHASARDRTQELVDAIPRLRGLDAGSLSNAAAIEAFTAVLLELNARYKTRAAIRVTGIETQQE